MLKIDVHPDVAGGPPAQAGDVCKESGGSLKPSVPLQGYGLSGDTESPASEPDVNKTVQNQGLPQTTTWSSTALSQHKEVEQDKKVNQTIRRGMSWTGPSSAAAGWTKKPSQERQRPLAVTEPPWKEGGSNRDEEIQDQEWKVVRVKPVVNASTNQQGRKTNLSRSASLSEKELKEARDRSQIIAAQLTIPTNSSSRGVQLFNRRKQRVNAFTLVSFGKGVQQQPGGNKTQGPLHNNSVTWEEKCSEGTTVESSPCSSSSKTNWCPGGRKYTGTETMAEQIGGIHEVENTDHLGKPEILPVDGIDELPVQPFCESSSTEIKDEPPSDVYNISTDQPANGLEVTETNGTCADILVKPAKIQNGCSSTADVTLCLTKQPPAITNRTAKPFGSPAMVRSPEARSPVIDLLPPAPISAAPLPTFSNPPPVSRVISPSPQYTSNIGASLTPAFVPQHIKQPVPVKTGILEEGAARRATRKSMFTFQEKPKLAPNPELLSLVQGVDEKKKQKQPSEHTQDEELLALGAEASNFQTKADSEEVKVPEWSTCLKSSGARVRSEPKPAQGLMNVAGKGAELFAKRQSRMEKYVVEAPSMVENFGRSPSPTMSLPPSWTFPSNMPGRVKAMASSSHYCPNPSRTSRSLAAASYGNQERSMVENGCTKKEMDIIKHQPYQLNSSLFILNPAKDPMSSLPKAAPPPKPMVLDKAYTRQASLPLSPPSPSPLFTCPAPFRATKGFSPQIPPSPVNGVGTVDFRPNREPEVVHIASPVSALSPERVSSPKPGIHTPRPTFSAKRAGIEPQTQKAPVPVAATWTPTLSARVSSPESTVKAHPATEVQLPSSRSPYPSTGSSPISPPWEDRCQSPIGQDIKTNRRLLAKNIINAARRKNSPSPGGLNGRGTSISPVGGSIIPHGHQPLSPSTIRSRALSNQSPSFKSPPATPSRMIRSPVHLYTTRSLTDSDASVESEDSGLRSPSIRSHNTCPRGWEGNFSIKRGSIPADL
nr:PREDICTED: synaptopodin [Lepisosteus oculatus]XP_015205275.1 PREDICTED: synaptopodin [Lepisosteus oculatus]